MNKTKKTLLTWMLALGLVLTLIWAAGASAAGTVDATAAENLALAEAGVSREQATGVAGGGRAVRGIFRRAQGLHGGLHSLLCLGQPGRGRNAGLDGYRPLIF